MAFISSCFTHCRCLESSVAPTSWHAPSLWHPLSATSSELLCRIKHNPSSQKLLMHVNSFIRFLNESAEVQQVWHLLSLFLTGTALLAKESGIMAMAINLGILMEVLSRKEVEGKRKLLKNAFAQGTSVVNSNIKQFLLQHDAILHRVYLDGDSGCAKISHLRDALPFGPAKLLLPRQPGGLPPRTLGKVSLCHIKIIMKILKIPTLLPDC